MTETTQRIGLVITGGTIGSEFQADSVVRLPKNAEPEVELLNTLWTGTTGLEVRTRHPMRRLSENMRPSDWVSIAESVLSLVEEDDVSGLIVLHGTDTAIYTAAALSFLLARVEQPVVVTGSNLPPNQPNSDAAKNIADALVAVAHLGRGTYLSFAGSPELPSWVHLGTHVRKVRASGQAFFSVNRRPVAQVASGRFVPIEPFEPRASNLVGPHMVAVDDKVLWIKLFPGCDLATTFEVMQKGTARGVVVEMYASGTAADDGGKESLVNFVEMCRGAGIVVVATVSDAPEERANFYDSAVALQESRAIFSWTMLPEVAVVKLMWALAQSDNPRIVRDLVRLPIAGEIDEQSFVS